MKRVLLYVAVTVMVVIGALTGYVLVAWDKSYDLLCPDCIATTDSALVERGRYLAFGPAHCATCHVPMDNIMAVENGLEIPLSGGWELSIPPGTFRAPNITPDVETGIGGHTDGELARALRYCIKKDGRGLFPFMPFQNMTEYDLTAVISFLRSQAPVRHFVPPSELSFLGKAIVAFSGPPEGPVRPPMDYLEPTTTKEYGEYLAHSIANCRGCHTERDLKTGDFIGPDFAGGMQFEPDAFSNGYSFVTPNLTPDPTTGVIAHWDEPTFIARFRAGRSVQPYSPMPWGAFSRMTDTDLKALYRYLKSLDPIKREVNPVVIIPST